MRPREHGCVATATERTNTDACKRRRIAMAGAAALAAAVTFGPYAASAGDLPGVGGPAPLVAAAPPGDFISAWLAMATATQAAQPHWMTPLITVTPRLEQEFRADFYGMTQATGTHINNFGAGKGLEIIPTPETELIIGYPPFEQYCPANANCSYPPAGKTKANDGFGDWSAFLLKYRFAAANEENGNYAVTGFVQMSVPTGVNNISNDVYIIQPTIAFGKGWGDFDFQATISQQYPFQSINPAVNTISSFGDPVLVNAALQYHLFQYLWPEFEVNYEYWPNGIHKDLTQVLLTPGIIIGRIPLGIPRQNLIVGVGYQFAVTDHPVTNNNLVVTARMTF
jgi:hypothetical protein